jgi:hypothetical protein
MSDRLIEIKYKQPKSTARDLEVQSLIDAIQADCYIISQDKQDYTKE